MIHKQEEVEQLELEQALAMSLLAEGERLRMARVEAKSRPDDDGDDDKGMPHECDAKPSRSGDTSADKTRKGSPPPPRARGGGGGGRSQAHSRRAWRSESVAPQGAAPHRRWQEAFSDGAEYQL